MKRISERITGKQQTYLADFHDEVKAVARNYALSRYVGEKYRIISDKEITGQYCGVLGVRMAIVWGVTRGTANRRLQALAAYGVFREPRYGHTHCDSYKVSEELGVQYVNEAIQHWISVGYSQTEFREKIHLESKK
ncbi:hypothetical protein [Undibacterium crateris]|uniref:hypothetical protein n=1 Tax=Undibacterium crateris TaxID=2528175 RepID=UPI001389B5B7|nr:hypothetical protein [Undibacterium crateris]NDI85038.1 hypothetical protein [Undibacterium crateris]